MSGPTTHDDYLADFPPEQRATLERMRALVRSVAPGAVETIGYGIPTFKLGGRNLVHYAGFAKHDSFFPGSAALSDALDADVAPWRTGKGTLQFRHGTEIPWGLLERIVRLRVEEETARVAAKPPARTSSKSPARRD